MSSAAFRVAFRNFVVLQSVLFLSLFIQKIFRIGIVLVGAFLEDYVVVAQGQQVLAPPQLRVDRIFRGIATVSRPDTRVQFDCLSIDFSKPTTGEVFELCDMVLAEKFEECTRLGRGGGFGVLSATEHVRFRECV